MKYFFLALFLVVGILLETTCIAIPFDLIFLFIFIIFYPKEIIFLIAILSGILLDSLLFRPIGSTSLFFITFLGFVLLYRQRFEMQSVSFAIVFMFIGGFTYFIFFGSTNVLVQLFCTVMLSSFVFGAYWLLIAKTQRQKNLSLEELEQ